MPDYVGVPETIWVVMKRQPGWDLEDYFFETNIVDLMTCARGGMDENAIIGFYVDKHAARCHAQALLSETLREATEGS